MKGSPTLWIPSGTNPSGFNQTASTTYTTTTTPNQITVFKYINLSMVMEHKFQEIWVMIFSL
jgi:hypothetical protein